MGQRDVTDEEIREAEAKAHRALELDSESWCALERRLKDGRVLYLVYQGRGMTIGISQKVGDRTFHETYDYFHSGREGWRAALGWDEEGEPDGWCRARTGWASTYRRRPDGDATKEYQAP